MVSTHLSLLERVCEGSDWAWQQLTEAYRPLISWWMQRHNIERHDAEDISQEVMIVVHRRLHEFDHNGNVGAFRTWLRLITINQLRSYLRKNRNAQAIGGEEVWQQLSELQDEKSLSTKLWDQQHDQFVIRQLVESVHESCEPRTIAIFQKLVLENLSAEEVAEQMNITVGTVYSARSRVMRKIRKSGQDLFEGR